MYIPKLNLYVAYTTVIMLLGTFPVALKFRFFKDLWPVRVQIIHQLVNLTLHCSIPLVQWS